jgi:hypothetical protein
MNSPVLLFALGAVMGLVLGQALKQCPAAAGVAPAAGKGWFDVIIAGLPVAKDLLDEWTGGDDKKKGGTGGDA